MKIPPCIYCNVHGGISVYKGLCFTESFHRKLYTLPLMVYTHYFYAYVLMYADHCGRVAHELVGKL